MTRLYRFPTPTAGMRIGLLGGSFDPAHSGHAHVARIALRRLKLDYVWWIPARGNPLKSTETPYPIRFASAVALARHPRMHVLDIEQKLGLRYTIHLVRALKALAPAAHFVWLMGGDNLLGFHRWQDWDEIARTLPIAVVARPGAGPRARLSKFASRYAQSRLPTYRAAALADHPAPAWIHLRGPLNPESSTRLRRSRGANPDADR